MSSGTYSSGETISVDPSAVRSALAGVKFARTCQPGTYSREYVTYSYICSVFAALDQIEQSWNSLKESVNGFLDNVEGISKA